jgi:preprotein translocase subunit SecG
MSATDPKRATAEQNPPAFREVIKPDLLTVVAITIAAIVIATLIHEGLGHGGMCVATGGQARVLSTVHFECSVDTRLVSAGGTLANLILGTLFLFAARAVKQSATWRYFFWLLMTFNLFDAGGYFLFSGIGNIGDWAAVVAGWQPAWAWRVGLTALGIVTYFFLFVPLSLRELRPFLGKDAKMRVHRAKQLALVPYLTAGTLSCIAGALNPVGPILILISAAASSFGGHSGLAWMWNLLHGPRVPSSQFQMPEIERSRGWIIAAVVLAIGFIAGLGPGVKF